MTMNQNDWDQLKVEYEQIHAPQELEERLRKVENEYQSRRHPNAFFLWGGRVAACICCAVIGISVAANTSAAAAQALQSIPIIGDITKVVTFRHYHSGDSDIKTPHVTELGDKEVEKKLNQEFDKYADALIAQYESDVKAWGNGGHEAITSSYKVLVDNNSQLTIAMDTLFESGDSMEISRYYNVDKKSGRILKLRDLFQNGANYVTPINSYISKEIQKSPQDYFTDEDGNEFKTIAKDQNFYINKDGKLLIVFDEGSIAPAYKGGSEFIIPTNLISTILADNSFVH